MLTQALQRQVGVELVDLAALAHDDASGAAGGDDADVVLSKLFARAADEGV
jgi:hypothetical protein